MSFETFAFFKIVGLLFLTLICNIFFVFFPVCHYGLSDNPKYRQNNCHLNKSIYFIERKEIHDCIYRNIENHPNHLLSEIAAICTKCQDAKACYTTPIAEKSDQTNKDHKNRLNTLLNSFAVCNAQHYQSPGKWPHNTGLVQNLTIVKRNKRFPANKISWKERICKMRYKSKHK